MEELLKGILREAPRGAYKLPPALTELELIRHMEGLSAKNLRPVSFLGAGAYDRFIPAAVWALALRGEFATAYTPYQAEASQGTLQAIYEFQSMVCELYGMDAANASLYDGASALAEAVGAALRSTERKKVLLPRSLHPDYRRTIRSYYASHPEYRIEEVAAPEGTLDLKTLAASADGDTACVVVQNPNFFGCLEQVEEVVRAAHERGALAIVCADPVSLGLLKSPGECGADIAVGEGQGLGIPLSFGGPTLGLFTCKEPLLRKMPGRICGMTEDRNGRRGFVLTLQAREQHIRREKATSNVCTNQGLCALAATVHMALLGPEGLKEAAALSARAAHDLADQLGRLKGFKLRFGEPFFQEFVLECPRSPEVLQKALLKEGLLPGLPLGPFYPELKDCLLVCATEKTTEGDMGRLVSALRSHSR